MLAIILYVGFFFGVAMFAPVHAAGMWLIIMIIHGLLVEVLGETAAHLPLYVGVTVSLCILFRGRWSAYDQVFSCFSEHSSSSWDSPLSAG